MNDTEYRERCRELEKNIHMLESEVNVLNNECERLSDLKEKSRNSLQMSSFGDNPIFVEKAQVNMEKEIPTIGKSQDKKTEDKSEISQEKKNTDKSILPVLWSKSKRNAILWTMWKKSKLR